MLQQLKVPTLTISLIISLCDVSEECRGVKTVDCYGPDGT